MSCDCGDSGNVEINTGTSCNATETCVPSTASAAITVGSCACGCNPCQCEQQRNTGSLPFYNQASSCQEDHTKVLIQQTFITAVSSGNAFNMPACDTSITFYLPGVQSLQVGSYLWNVTYGYLRVVAFDFTTGRVTVINECQLSNASPGTPIPSCTMFNVVDPPYEPDGDCGDGIFTTADFVAPIFGASVTIQVTGTSGLTVGVQVQVGTGVYTLTAILTPYSVIIRNAGGIGIIPGVTIHAKDALGNCITPVTTYGPDPCNETPEDSGSLVICGSTGLTTLNAARINQVPVCTDATDNLVEFKDVGLPVYLCTYLTACLTIISGTDVYIVLVDDSTDFYVGQVVVVIHYPDIEDLRWVITDIPSSTQIEITAIIANTYTGTVPELTELCEAPCCDQLDYELNNFGDIICDQDWSAAFKGTTAVSHVAGQFGTITEGNTFTADTRSVSLSNDTCNTMRFVVQVNYLVQASFDVTEMSWARVSLKPYYAYTTAVIPGVPAAPVPALLETLLEDITFGSGPGTACNKFDSYYYAQYHHSAVIAIPPNTNIRLDAYQEFQYLNYKEGVEACCACVNLDNDSSGDCTVTNSEVTIDVVGFAIKEA